jgi:hypothetical protein
MNKPKAFEYISAESDQRQEETTVSDQNRRLKRAEQTESI